MTKDDNPLPCHNASPTMRNRLGEVGSQSHGFFSSLSALHALLLLTPVLLMVSGVGAMSGGSLVTPRPGEARVMCPLTKYVNQTKHSIVIRHFPYKGNTVNVFNCAWLKKDPDKPDCRSYHNFTLVSLEKDYVVTSVPRTQLHKDGSYKCQLVPPDDDEPYTRCLVFHSDDAEDPTTTISAVTPSTAASLPQPCDQTEREHTGANGDDPEVLAVILTVMLILLVIVIFMAVMIFRLGRARIRGTPENTLGNVKMSASGVASTDEEGHDVTPEGPESEKHMGSPLLGKVWKQSTV